MTKQILVFLLTSLSGITAMAADATETRPFIEEGKTWTVGYYRYFDLEPFMFTDYVLSGDTVIAGTVCKKMYERHYHADGTDEQTLYSAALTEADGRVYVYPPSSVTSGLLYDFTAFIDQTLALRALTSVPEGSDVEAQVIDERDVEVGESSLHCICIQDDYDVTESRAQMTYTLWIDGVGGSKGPLWNCHTNTVGLGVELISCHVGDRVIYRSSQNPDSYIRDILSGISSPTTQQMKNGKSENSEYFDLTGRRLAAPPARGLYIEDGKVRSR